MPKLNIAHSNCFLSNNYNVSMIKHDWLANYPGALFIDINPCSQNPCENGGTCLDHVTAYSCKCVPGYIGINCEVANRFNIYNQIECLRIRYN